MKRAPRLTQLIDEAANHGMIRCKSVCEMKHATRVVRIQAGGRPLYSKV